MRFMSQHLWQTLLYLRRRFIDEGFTYRAASLAYTTLLGLVPLTIIGFEILSLFPIFKGVGEQLQAIILNNFVAAAAATISVHLEIFLDHASALSWANLIILVVVGLLMMYNVNQAFNAVWRVRRRIYLSFSFVIYLLVLLLTPIVLGLLLILGTVAVKYSHLAAWLNLPIVQLPLLFVLRFVLVFATFTILNWVLPSCKVAFRHAAYGGLITTVLFEIAKAGFGFYLDHFPTYRLIYGALATVPIFFVWLYVAWIIILLSALITEFIAHGLPNSAAKFRSY